MDYLKIGGGVDGTDRSVTGAALLLEAASTSGQVAGDGIRRLDSEHDASLYDTELGNFTNFSDYYSIYNYYNYNGDMTEFITNELNQMPPGLPGGVKSFIMVAFAVIILLSLAGNSLVILVVARHAKMRTVTNAFLVSLAVSDLLVAGVTMPVQLVWYVDRSWTLGEAMCKFIRYFQGVVIVASILTLTGIALDRYYAICHPLRARHVHTLTRAGILIFAFWVGGFLAVLPQIFIQRLEPLIQDLILDENATMILDIRMGYSCVEYFSSHNWNIVFTFYTYIFLYLGPVVVVFVTYGRIAYKLWKRQPIGETLDCSRDGDRRLKEKKRIVRMLVVIVVLFAVSWFPYFTYHIYNLFEVHSAHDQRYIIAQAFFQLSGYTNCCVNPIIYCFMNESFKKHFYKTMCCCKCFWRQWRAKRRGSTTEMNGLTHLTPMVSTNISKHSSM